MSGSTALLEDAIGRVGAAGRPGDPVAVQAHLDALTKPPGSLGRLEELALQVGCVLGDPPPSLDDAVVFVFAADHGVAARGVSAYPAAVTAQMCANFSGGGAAVNVLTRACGAEVPVISVSLTVTDPDTGFRMQAMEYIRVVFPAPLGPRIQVIAPCLADSVTPLSASILP